jgi:acetate kinase
MSPARSAICRAGAWLGLKLDEGKPRTPRTDQHSQQPCRRLSYMVKTDENLMIARHARAVVES